MVDEIVKVGIDIIDTEHARLIEILGQIEAAHARGHRRASARLLRTFLTAFDRHFETESRLLRDLGCHGLGRRHSEFITSRSMMVAHPMDARDAEQAARIIEFARAWLYDHIMRQDGAIGADLASRAAGAGLTGPRLLDRIPLRWRMAILGVVPLVIMLGLAALSFGTLVDSLHSAGLMHNVVQLDARIADLVYELQEESNQAIMVVGSPRRDRAHFKGRIAGSDAAIAAFRRAAEAMRAEKPDKAVIDGLDNAEASLSLISRSRSDVQAGSYDVYSTIEYYGTTVADLMEIVPTITRKLDPSEIARKVDAYGFLVSARERSGAERSLGTSLLSGVTVDILSRDPKRIVQLATEEDSLGRTFQSLSQPPFSDAFGTASAISPMFGNMRRAIAEGAADRPTALDWSDTSGLRIDRIRAVERGYIAAIEGEVATFSAQAWRHALFFGGGIVAAVALSMTLIALIGWGLLPPLNRLRVALRRLADGDRLVALPDGGGQDEIAELARAFVLLRDRLVESDLNAAKRGTENADRLRTTLDGLPGVVFRIAQVAGAPTRVVAASNKLRHLTGLEDKDVLDRPLGSVIRACLAPEDRVSLLHVLRRLGRSPLDFECRLRSRPEGRTRWMRVLATPVETGDGCIWDGVALDVTMAKEAEREQARLREELDRLHRSRTATRLAGDIGNDLSHLWSPLLENSEGLLRRLPDDSPLRDQAMEIHQTALRMRDLSERLSAVDESGRPPRPIDVVDRLARRFAVGTRTQSPGLVVETRFEARGTLVLADAEIVELMVDNLVAYVDETLGTEAGTVTIATDVRTGDGTARHLCIAIRDDRSGLASHTLAKVLRTRTSRVPGSRGEELSLAIVRMIVDGARGWVQSGRSTGGHTVLEVFLPVWEGRTDNVIRFERAASWSSHDH